MTTILTETGWEDEGGEQLGTWTNRADVVDEGDEIRVDVDTVADTLRGGDTIIGDGGDFGIDNDGTIDTGDGLLGIFNDNDTITGTGEFEFGIDNRGTIVTGKGKDNITGNGGGAGILNFSEGTIDTGEGNDTVDALTGGFEGGGTIDLGQGNDLIRGFGEQIVDGGQGFFDTAELGLDFDQVILGNAEDSSIEITFDGETMAFTDVELFKFNDIILPLGALQEIA